MLSYFSVIFLNFPLKLLPELFFAVLCSVVRKVRLKNKIKNLVTSLF